MGGLGARGRRGLGGVARGRGGTGELTASADARRQTASPESCRSLRQLPSITPPIPSLPLPSVRRAHTRMHARIRTHSDIRI